VTLMQLLRPELPGWKCLS